MEIYWIKDKQRRGPATVPDVIALVQMGELTPDTPGWHAGCSSWLPLKELPALVDFLGELKDKSKNPQLESLNLPPLPPQPTVTPPTSPTPTPPSIDITIAGLPKSGITGPVSLPAPWARLAARLVDSSLYAAIAMGLLSLTGISYSDIIMPLFWLPMIFLEALMLWRKGTTPGKAIMGITVSTIGTGQRMQFGRAFFRSLSVNLIGMGCYLFPICMVTMCISYFMLTRRGLTMWDAQSMTLPIQLRKTGVLHYIMSAVLIYVMMQVTAFSLLQIPGAIETVEQISPDTVRQLREVMPNLPSTSSANQTETPQPLR